MNILRSKISQGGERWVRVRIKTSSSSDSSNLQKGGVFRSTRAGSICWRLPPCTFPLLRDMHQQLTGVIIWGRGGKKTQILHLGRREGLGGGVFLCTVRTSAVAADLFLWHFLACAEPNAGVSCWSKPIQCYPSTSFNTQHRATWVFGDSRNSLILFDTREKCQSVC